MPRRDGDSPRMELLERRVTGARCPVAGNALPSPMMVRILVALLTPMTASEIRTAARGLGLEVGGQGQAFGADVAQLGRDVGDDSTELGGRGNGEALGV